MSIYAEKYGEDIVLTRQDKEELIKQSVAEFGDVKKVLILPPDYTRFHSNAGELTAIYYDLLTAQGAEVDILPAIGTHFQMTDEEISSMFGSGVPRERFLVHDWRNGITKVGEIPSGLIQELSEGKLDYSIDVELDNAILEGGYDLILSIGQVVPHEVSGMANQNKNIFVGAGGSDIINKSHFLGAVYNMERIMGRADTPVRQVLNYAEDTFLADTNIVYALTVMSRQESGDMVMNGLFIGPGREGYEKAASLSQKLNITQMDTPLEKVVVYLEPDEFKSTWLGNKAVYRTRMVMADEGELFVIAPGLAQFGEDGDIDKLIRKYGYVGTPAVLKAVEENEDLRTNLSAAAHLIHGSSEGRFGITYAPGNVTQEEITSVNFKYAPLEDALKTYDVENLKDGFNTLENGEEIYYISNPAIGLWGLKENFT
jgi:nickel-dependent lactate racemase